MSLYNNGTYTMGVVNNPLVEGLYNSDQFFGPVHPFPPGDLFKLLDGTNFLLLDNTNFLLL